MKNTSNGIATVNEAINGNTATQETHDSRQPIDRTKEVLISNETSFEDLIRILQGRPEAVAAEKVEEEEKAREAKDEQLRKLYGEDYDLIVELEKPGKDELEKAKRRPGAVQLRTYVPCIARMDIGGGVCEAFTNGYAVYDNGDRKTVLWIPDCGTFTYYFDPLRDSEKEYQKQTDVVGEDVLGPSPWYFALMLAGERSIENNLDRPRSKGTVSDADTEEWLADKPGNHRVGVAHFDSPEEAYLKKEAAEERRKALTERQKEVYDLYFNQGYTQEQIAEMLGISQPAVKKLLDKVVKRCRECEEKK